MTGKEAKLEEELAEAILNIAPVRANMEADLLTQPRIEEVVAPGGLKLAGEINQRIAGSHLGGA